MTDEGVDGSRRLFVPSANSGFAIRHDVEGDLSIPIRSEGKGDISAHLGKVRKFRKLERFISKCQLSTTKCVAVPEQWSINHHERYYIFSSLVLLYGVLME
jgi:hypothetical protein